MFNTLLVVSLVLAGQLSGADGRYPLSAPAQGTTPNTNPIGSSSITPITGSAPPPSSAPSSPPRSTTSAPSGSTYSPPRSPAFNSGSAPANTVRPLAPAYPAQPSFPTSESAAQQLPSKSA